jgi:hypothetical protein
MYRIEWNQRHQIVNTWDEVIKHPMFSISSIYERTPIGWCAL